MNHGTRNWKLAPARPCPSCGRELDLGPKTFCCSDAEGYWLDQQVDLTLQRIRDMGFAQGSEGRAYVDTSGLDFARIDELEIDRNLALAELVMGWREGAATTAKKEVARG